MRRVPLVDNVSSSHIRALLAAGDVEHAAKLLGRPAEVEGIVVTGDQRGEGLGFPTANLARAAGRCSCRQLGIYAGVGARPPRRHLDRRRTRTTAAPSGGSRLYLLDYAGDLYGRRLVVELWERLRDEAAFGSEAELIEAIEQRRRPTRAAARPA